MIAVATNVKSNKMNLHINNFFQRISFLCDFFFNEFASMQFAIGDP